MSKSDTCLFDCIDRINCPEVTNLNYVHEETRRRLLMQKGWYYIFQIICHLICY
jgi:hypothetical protein